MENKTIYADGMFVKKGMAHFIKAKVGINVAKFTEFLNQHKDEKGYVNIDILESKDGDSIYAKLDNWKPAVKPDFRTSPDQDGNRIDMATHPLNSPKEQEEYDKALKDW